MYGFINSALEKLIIRRFGEEIWQEVYAKAAVIGEEPSFKTHTIYDDEDTVEIIKASVDILGIDPGSILEMFGEQFLLWCQESGYAQTLHLLGHNLIDFLSNLDALHDHLSVIYPNMRAPSFRCSEGENGVITLHYYSERHGLESIVPGIVKCLSRELHDVEVMVECVDKMIESNGMAHVTFEVTRIEADNTVKKKRRLVHFRSSGLLPLSGVQPPTISQSLFCKAFPFHIIFDRDMRVRQLGTRLKKLINKLPHEEILVTSIFSLQRPRLEFTFQNILDHIHTVYILSAAIDLSSLGKTLTDDDTFLRLRGQMLYMEESNCMLYVCSPYVRSLADLKNHGLYISDIPIHDASRGLIITEGALNNEFQYSVNMEYLLIEKEELTLMIEERKERMRNLLLEIMPSSVANKLLQGSTVEARNFKSVTILLSDIVGFTRICQRCKPNMVVSMLNNLYCFFDQVLSRNNVYKVETIGDAYMVVGGLPEPNKTHAADVCNQAIDMMMCAQKVTDPTNPDKSITIRIGIHSGEVAAGVVGIRMPRYCLFGDTVNVASRTESNSVPGRINVTEWTYAHLCGKPNWLFEVRGPVHFKNVDKPVVCYWLIENMDRLRQPKPSLQRPTEVPVFAEFIPTPASTSRNPSQNWESSFPDFYSPSRTMSGDSNSETLPFSESVASRLAHMEGLVYRSHTPSEVPSRSISGDSDDDGGFLSRSNSSTFQVPRMVLHHLKGQSLHRHSIEYLPGRSRSTSKSLCQTIDEAKEISTDLSKSLPRSNFYPFHKSSDSTYYCDHTIKRSSESLSCSNLVSNSSTLTTGGGNPAHSKSDSELKTSSLSPEPARKGSNISEHSGIDSGCDPLDPTESEIEGTSETHQSTRRSGLVNCTGIRNGVQQINEHLENLQVCEPNDTS